MKRTTKSKKTEGKGLRRTRWPNDPKDGSFLMVDKRMIRKYGFQFAVFVANLLDKYIYFHNRNMLVNDRFFITTSEMRKQINMSPYQIRKCKELGKLERMFSMHWRGSPAKDWFELNLEHVDIQAAIKKLNGKPLKNLMASPKETLPLIRKTNKEEHIKDSSSYDLEDDEFISRFELFWEVYPKQLHKKAAEKEWKELSQKNDRPALMDIMQALHAQKKTGRWKDSLRDNEGQYIPYPATWIKDKRWTDDPAFMTGNHAGDMPDTITVNGRRYERNEGGYKASDGHWLSDDDPEVQEKIKKGKRRRSGKASENTKFSHPSKTIVI